MEGYSAWDVQDLLLALAEAQDEVRFMTTGSM
jgi:hypothetical protein